MSRLNRHRPGARSLAPWLPPLPPGRASAVLAAANALWAHGCAPTAMALGIGLLGACALGPDYRRPELDLPKTWHLEGPRSVAAPEDLRTPTRTNTGTKKADATKTDAKKTDTTKADTTKADATKADATKADAAKSDATKANAAQFGATAAEHAAEADHTTGAAVASADALESSQSAVAAAAEDGNRLADLSWKQAFADPHLQALIEEALQHNFDLAQAVARVDQYHALYGVQQSALGPDASLRANAGYGKNPLTQSLGRTNGATTGRSGARASFATNFYATWELDFWGRLRRLSESALADYLATDEARQATALTLVANVATAYIELVQLTEQLALAERTVENFRQMLALYDLQLRTGAGSAAPVATAMAQVADAEATRENTAMLRDQAEVGLCLLLGSAPRTLEVASSLEPLRRGAELPLGAPAELLERRPDVRQAEASLRSSNAQMGAAKAALFPSLSLTGLFGVSATSLAHPRQQGSTMSLIGGGPSWSLPIPFFGGMQVWHRYDASQSTRLQAELAYRSAVLAAVGEVQRAVRGRTGSRRVAEARGRQVAELGRALHLATDRYRQGTTSFVEVTQAQNALFAAEQALVQVRAQEASTFVTLYRTLGGGWH